MERQLLQTQLELLCPAPTHCVPTSTQGDGCKSGTCSFYASLTFILYLYSHTEDTVLYFFKVFTAFIVCVCEREGGLEGLREKHRYMWRSKETSGGWFSLSCEAWDQTQLTGLESKNLSLGVILPAPHFKTSSRWTYTAYIFLQTFKMGSSLVAQGSLELPDPTGPPHRVSQVNLFCALGIIL